MFNWFKKSAPEHAQEPTKSSGFFSTDSTINKNMKRSDRLAKHIKKSIQRTPDDFIFHDDNGQQIAMDDSSFSSIKAAYTGGRGSLPEEQFSWYASQGFIGYQACAILSQNWLIDKVCTMPAEDAARNWFDITINSGTALSPEVLDKITEADEDFDIANEVVQFVRKHLIFGIRVALFIVESDDPMYYELPFNPDGITPGSYKGISQIDPYWVIPELSTRDATDPMSINFYRPTWYQVNGKRVHRSHMVIIKNSDVPDILKPTYYYGGVPLPQRIAERVYAAERTANEAPMLALTKRSTVLQTDMEKVMADQAAFESKLDLWAYWRNNFGIKAIGEDEKVEQFDTTLADFDDLVDGQYELVCAIGEAPVTKVMGISPGGMNATGEYDEANYGERLKSIQTHKMTRFLKRHYLCWMRSEMPSVKAVNISITWKPTDDPTAKELSEINYKNAQRDSLLVLAGGIDGQDVRDRLVADPNSGYNALSGPAPLPPEEDEPEDKPGEG